MFSVVWVSGSHMQIKWCSSLADHDTDRTWNLCTWFHYRYNRQIHTNQIFCVLFVVLVLDDTLNTFIQYRNQLRRIVLQVPRIHDGTIAQVSNSEQAHDEICNNKITRTGQPAHPGNSKRSRARRAPSAQKASSPVVNPLCCTLFNGYGVLSVCCSLCDPVFSFAPLHTHIRGILSHNRN